MTYLRNYFLVLCLIFLLTGNAYSVNYKVLLEKHDAKKKGWVWEHENVGWCRVIEYEYLKETSKRNPNKYTDKCKVKLEPVENDNPSFVKNVMDYNGDYFMSNKKYKLEQQREKSNEKKKCPNCGIE